MSDQAVAQSPEERMMAFVEQDAPKPEDDRPARYEDEKQPEQEEASESQDAPEATEEEPKDEEPEEQEPERVIKLKHDGVEIDKPESEVITLAQQGFDYTQKTQKLAEERKQVETMAATIKEQETAFQQQVQIQTALISEIAEITAIDKQLSQYQNLNWQQMSDSDPVEAQKLFFAYNQLQVQRGQAITALNSKKQGLTEAQAQTRAKQVELGWKVLEKDIPGWNKEMARSIMESGRQYGFNDEELGNLTDPRAVKLLHDASQWRKLQASKPTVDKKVATASPTVKPGAKNTTNATNASVKSNREALRKTGKSDYAAKLIERMI